MKPATITLLLGDERVDHPDRIVWTVTAVTSEPKRQIDGQMSLMESL